MHFTVIEPVLQISAQRHLPFNISEDAVLFKVNTSNSNQFEQGKRGKTNLEIKEAPKGIKVKSMETTHVQERRGSFTPSPLGLYLHHKWKKGNKAASPATPTTHTTTISTIPSISPFPPSHSNHQPTFPNSPPRTRTRTRTRATSRIKR